MPRLSGGHDVQDSNSILELGHFHRAIRRLESKLALALILSAFCQATFSLALTTWEQAGQNGAVSAVATSPDGAWIASGSDDATVKLWRASDGGLECTLAATGLFEVTSLAFGPVGTNIIAAGYYDGSIRLWNTTNGALVRTFAKCSGKVSSLAFSPTGQQLAIGSGDWLTRILRLSDGAILNNSGNGSVLNYGVVRSVAALAPWLPDGEPIPPMGDRAVLLAHGSADHTTDPARTAQLAKKLALDGGDVELVTYPGARHAMLFPSRPWHDLVAGFMVRTLLAPAAEGHTGRQR